MMKSDVIVQTFQRVCAAVSLFILVACAQAPTHRPFSEMRGGCDNYRMNVSRELRLMSRESTSIDAVRRLDDATPTLKMDRPYAISLVPQESVMFEMDPQQARRVDNPRGGLLAFEASESGEHRVSASSGVWIDVVTGHLSAVQSETFEMQTGCAQLFKTVVFNLYSGDRYLLQLSGAVSPEVRLVVTRSR